MNLYEELIPLRSDPAIVAAMKYTWFQILSNIGSPEIVEKLGELRSCYNYC